MARSLQLPAIDEVAGPMTFVGASARAAIDGDRAKEAETYTSESGKYDLINGRTPGKGAR